MSIKINFIEKKVVKERVWKSLNIVVAVATVLNISGAAIWLQPSVAQAAPAANPSADLDQCANDQAPSPHTDGCATSATEWVNGNLGESKSVYLEGDSVPYRMRFENLTLGSHNVVIEWDTTKSGKHALDYITTYNRTVADANPCLGVTGCGAPTTFAIPADPQVTGAGVTPIAGNFTFYGGTITGVSAYSYVDGAGFTGDKSARITVTFNATSADPVLAWGGHIAHRQDWGVENSAVAIPGSPYHTRLIDLDGSGGNQDRSLSAAAVIFPASITIVKQATPEGSQSFGYTSTGGLSPASFSLVDDGSVANTRAFSGLTNFVTYTVSETALAGWTLSFNNPVCTVTTANGGSQSASSNTVTINLKEGENVTCTYKNERQAATLTVIKHVINDNGGTAVASNFTLDAGGAGDSPDNFPGAEAPGTVITLDAGAYNVTESGPAGYAAAYSADCSGTIAYGQSKTCTVTNNDIQPKLTVTKVVVNDNGGTKVIADFPLFVDATGVTSGVQNGFNAGTYTVSETNQAGYTSAISGDCAANGSVTLAVGDVKSCTITNNDQAATLIVKKVLVNDNGGNAVVTDFSFKVNNGNTIAFEGDAQNDLVVDAGTYTIVENAATGYATTYDNCSNVVIPNGGTATCTITNNDIAPTITLNKVVINNNGGNASVNDFGLTVGGTPVTSGQTVSVNANTPIALNEVGLSGYSFISLTGDAKCPAVLNGTVSLNEGENVTCTITNDDVAPTITLNKVVINNNGGDAGVNDFGLTVGGNGVTSGQTVSVNSNTPIALNEAGLTGYAFVSITGDAKCPAVLNGTVTLNEGENVTCTITNDDVAPSITLNKVVINDNDGTAGVNSFGLTIGGTPVNSGDTLNVMANTPVLLNEAGLFGYTFVSITGDAKCPAALNGAVTLDEGEHVTCTITNNDIAPRLTVYKIVINDDGGTAVSSDFTMTVAATNASPSQFPGSDLGTLVTLNQGAYSVTEAAFPGYTPAYSADCAGSINVGQSKICVVTNTDNTPHLIVIKNVINDNGGTAVAGDFTMNVAGTDVSDPSFPGDETGTTVSLDTGAYNVTESGPSGYAASFSVDCTGSIVLGQTKICTITNNDIAPQLTVIKHVVNDNGGNNVAADFTMQVGGTNVSNPSFPGDEAGTTVTLNQGAYTVGEIGLPGYVGTLSNDCVGTINVGEHKTCTITNDDSAPSITLSKFVVNNNGGTAGVNDFGLTIGGTAVTSGQVLAVNANQAYALNETGLFGYAFVSITGDAKCPAVLNGTVTLNEGESVSCTITNNDIAPELTVVKHVINDNGGNNVAADFTMNVTGTNVSDPSFPGDEAGTTVTLNQGAYAVDENAFAGYAKTLGANCSGTINVGESKTCTITNNDVAPTITLNKVVINDNGGTAGVNDFGLTIGGTPVTSGQVLAVDANQAYGLNEAGLFGYTFVSLTGDAKCPAVLNGTVTLNEGENVSCTITNDDVQPKLTVTKVVINDNGGNAVITDFDLFVDATQVVSGVQNGFNVGSYVVSEGTVNAPGYIGTISGDCDANGNVSLTVGQVKACTIANDDIAPTITLNKVVINDTGGNAGVNDFGLTIGGTPVTSGQTLVANANTPIVLNEAGLTGYTFVSLTGDAKCPAVLNGTVTLDEGENVTCTITNDDVAPTITLHKVVVNNNGGNAGVNDFGLTIGGTGVTSGQTLAVNANTPIALNEAGLAGYSFVSLTGDAKCPAVLNGTVTLNEGENVTCTITNDDVAPSLTLIKHVTNTNGGTAVDTDWTLTANGPTSLSGTTPVTSAANFSAGTYTLSESGPSGYDASNWTCQGGTLNGNQVSIALDEDVTCEITNDDHLADVAIVKTPSASTISAGGVVTYTMTWSITGQGFVRDAVIADTVPALTTYVANSISCGTTVGICTPNDTTSTLTWDIGDRVAGETGTVTFQATLNSPMVKGTAIDNTACISTPDDQNVCDTTTITVDSDFTVGITKTDNIDPVVAGGQVIYTLAWSVAGNAPLTSVIITDPIPANMTFVSATCGSTTGTCVISSPAVGGTGTVAWNLGAHLPGDFGSVTVTMQSASPIANGTVVTNVATVCGQMTTAQQAVVEKCLPDEETTTITSTPSISITKSNNIVGFTNPGKTVTYTVVVTNAAAATDTAHAVNMTDLLPAGFTFVDGGLGTKTFALGDIAPGASVTTTYVVNISASQLAGIYTNTASAQGSNTGKVSATSNVEVRVPIILGSSTSPELTITKKVTPKSTTPGKIVSYTVVVKNIGDGDAKDVVVTDTLPAGFTFVDGGGTTKTWNLGTLEPNHERTLNYQVMVGENVKAGNYVNVAVATSDGQSVEARATVQVKIPKVLGLATTGVSPRDFAIFTLGLSMIALSGLWISRQRRKADSFNA